MTTIDGTSGDDTLTGTSGDDTLYGLDGNDVLRGGLGNNDYYGGAGADVFAMSHRSASGFSDDLIHDFGKGDKIDVSEWGITSFGQLKDLLYYDSHGDATINAYFDGENHYLRIAHVDIQDLTSSDFIFSHASTGQTITGDDNGDTLFGTKGDDVINGGDGDDNIMGGAGNDTLSGGNGIDDFAGGKGFDTVTYAYDTDEGIHANLGKGYAEFGDGAKETLYSIEGIVGSGVADKLIGSDKANTIDGAGGNDVIEGGKGGDTLTGGLGNDTFVYSELSDSTVKVSGRDTITDFHSGDHISMIALEHAVGEDFSFIGTSAFTHVAGQINYTVSGGNTIISLDANGDGKADFSVMLTGSHTLGSGDFHL